jgi:nitroreductase
MIAFYVFFFERTSRIKRDEDDRMELSQLLQSRYSVRAYLSDPVEPEKLEKVLQAANLTPTACNRQPFRLIVLHTRGREAELRRIYHREWFVQVPIIIAIVTLPEEAWSRRDGANYGSVITLIPLSLPPRSIAVTAAASSFFSSAGRSKLDRAAGTSSVFHRPPLLM